MGEKKRIILGLGVLILLVVLIGGAEALRGAFSPKAAMMNGNLVSAVTLEAGNVPVYLDGVLAAGFSPDDLGELEKASFVEPVEGKTQEGWMLADVILLYVDPGVLDSDTVIIVSSSSREKRAQLTWEQVEQEENMVMFDLSGRGTLKLVSKQVEALDTREEWVQDVDKIEVIHP